MHNFKWHASLYIYVYFKWLLHGGSKTLNVVKDKVSRYEVKDEVSIYEVRKLYTHHKLDFPDPYIFATWWWTVNFKESRATCTMNG